MWPRFSPTPPVQVHRDGQRHLVSSCGSGAILLLVGLPVPTVAQPAAPEAASPFKVRVGRTPDGQLDLQAYGTTNAKSSEPSCPPVSNRSHRWASRGVGPGQALCRRSAWAVGRRHVGHQNDEFQRSYVARCGWGLPHSACSIVRRARCRTQTGSKRVQPLTPKILACRLRPESWILDPSDARLGGGIR